VNLKGQYITGNSPFDTSKVVGPEYDTQWIAHLYQVFGQNAVTLFQLDNEPELWDSTHRDVHPNPISYDITWNFTSAYSIAVKQQYPTVKIFGPICWGWCSYVYSNADGCTIGPDRRAHGNLPRLQWYIQQISNYKQSHNVQLVDYIDVHFYPAAPGVTGNSEDVLTSILRLRSTRSLWDPTYVDDSWIAEVIQLIPRIKGYISGYPNVNLGISISEYNFGADNLITGALAQTDALGIFAQFGVNYASRWVVPDVGSKAEQAFKVFLNYDGQGSQIKGSYVPTSSTNSDEVSAYAFVDPNATPQSFNTLYIVIVNKQSQGPVPVTVQVSGGASLTGTVSMYQFDPNNSLRYIGTQQMSQGSFAFSAVPYSVTLAKYQPPKIMVN